MSKAKRRIFLGTLTTGAVILAEAFPKFSVLWLLPTVWGWAGYGIYRLINRQERRSAGRQEAPQPDSYSLCPTCRKPYYRHSYLPGNQIRCPQPSPPPQPGPCGHCGQPLPEHELREDGQYYCVAAVYPLPLGERRERAPIPQDVKIAVSVRDGGRCRQCGSQDELQFDHVIPFSRGGLDTVANIQLLCGGCNRRKGAREAVA